MVGCELDPNFHIVVSIWLIKIIQHFLDEEQLTGDNSLQQQMEAGYFGQSQGKLEGM